MQPFSLELHTRHEIRESSRLMKIYLAVNGLGLGHIVRCRMLAEKLSMAGADVLFSTYLDGLEFARKKRLKTVKAVPVSYQVRSNGSVDLRATSARSGFSLGLNRFLHQLIREIQDIKRYAPDIVLIDTRLSSLLAARLLGKRTILILNQYRIRLLHDGDYPALGLSDRLFLLIARLGWTFFGTLIGEMWGLSERIIIPDFPPPLTISTYNLMIPKRHMSKVRFVGPIVDEQLYSDKPKQSLKRKYGFQPDEMLVYVAISGPKHEREPLVRKLIPILSNLAETFNIIVSQGNPIGDNVPSRYGRMCVYDWAENQDELLHACDVLIARAGQSTILKAMILGRPLILIPTPFQTEQLGNADRARSISSALVLEQEKLSSDSLKESLNLIMTNPSRGKRALQIANQVRDIVGVEECMTIIEQRVAERP
jgi:UDP-N-acetylglucosamine--N-acetylmuramyl-(pentapeptide) pyrophosphoryl-undecaprenol N-acetylglucosamine transferase